MQLQAPNSTAIARCKQSSNNQSFSLASTLLAAAALACVLASTVGCGNGVVLGTTQQQTTASPTASAKGPQLGYFWMSSDKTLRPILGVAGSSQIGQSVVPAGVYVGAASSASAGIAVLQDTDGSFDSIFLPSNSPVSLGLTLPAGATMRISPSGTSALAYTPGSTSASLITGLLTTPQVHTITAGGSITDSAVSDSGSVSFEYAQGSSVTVSVLPLSGTSSSIASVHSGGGITFIAGHDDLLFADATANTLTLVHSATAAPSTSVIPTSQLLKTPAAVGVSTSGRWALVANTGSQTLVRIDLSSQSATLVSCSCKPTLAATLADEGAFRVTDATSGPNWVVDAVPATPRTLFIPALPSSSKSNLVASAVVP